MTIGTVLITATAGVIAWLALCAVVLVLGLKGGSVEAHGKLVGLGTLRITAEARRLSTRQLAEAARRKGNADLEEATTGIQRLSRVRSTRVLWVDDNPDGNIREMLSMLNLGINVMPVRGTEQARVLLQGAQFDLVITDMNRGRNTRAGLDLIHTVKTVFKGREAEAPQVIVYSENPGASESTAIKEGAKVARVPGQLGAAIAGFSDERARMPAFVVRALSDVVAYVRDVAIGAKVPDDHPGQPGLAQAGWLGLIRAGWASRRGLVVALALTPVVAACGVVALLLVLNRSLPAGCVSVGANTAVSVALDAPGCVVPVGRPAFQFDCRQEFTIPPAVLVHESRDYAGHPIPVPGDGSVTVQDATCVIDDPRQGVQTQLRSQAPQPADAVVVVDFAPTSLASQVTGISLRGSGSASGVGVYLFAGGGGGQFAEDTGQSTTFRQLNGGTFNQVVRSNEPNRLVLCVQGGHVQGWLNGQRLGPADLSTSVPATPGDVIVSLQDFDPSQSATIAISDISVFHAAPQGCPT